MRRYRCVIGILIALSLTGGCRRQNEIEVTCDIAVANAYLESIVRDLCGPDEAVFTLAPPGMCPAHFDISPSQVRQLATCQLMLVFDFQKNIETGLAGFGNGDLAVASVAAPEGLCIPERYLAAAQVVEGILCEHFPERKAEFDERLENLTVRMKELEAALAGSIQEAGLVGAGIVTSGHQAEFVNWLGMNVISRFNGRDIETAAGLNASLQKAASEPVRVVIANRPEGTDLAQAVADRFGVAMVVFDNFPNDRVGSAGSFFEAMVRGNVDRLVKANER